MTRVASYVVNEPQMHRAPFIRVLLANEWETTKLNRPVHQEQLDPRRRVTPEMNIPHGKKTPRRG